MTQLELDLDIPECECLTFRDYWSGQRSIEFRKECPQHRIYLDRFWFRMMMFYDRYDYKE